MTSARRVLAIGMIAAGLGLCAAAVWHYVRGYGAQAEGRRAWDERPRPHQPGEYPGVVSASSRPSISSVPAGEPVARIRIPSADVDYVVFEGTDASTLEKGPGHVPGTQLPGSPVGPNNCVITGHRDSHFRHLGWLREGHRIEIETPAGATQSYQIVSRRVVDPTAVQVLDPTPTPRLTLITCYPFNYVGPAPKRLVLVAEPVS